MNSFGLTAAVTALANSIACNLSTSELALAASLLVQLGDTLATIAAESVLIKENAEDGKE